MPKINQGVVKATPIPRPSLDVQERLIELSESIATAFLELESALRLREAVSASVMEALFQSIVDRGPPDGSGGKNGSRPASAEEPPIAPPQRGISPKNPASPGPNLSMHAEPPAAPVDTKFQEAALVSAIVKTFFADGGEPIGNFRLQKAVYFARRHNGERALDYAFLKKAAGPYNPTMKYAGGIAIAKSENFISEARGRFGFGHIPGAKFADLVPAIKRYGYDKSAEWVHQHFKFKKNEDWELLATVDYAMLHLRNPSATDIHAYVAEDPEWRPKIEKLGLTDFKIESAMLEVRALFPGATQA
jgi:hypothetical protein